MKGLRGTDPALWPIHEPVSIETAEDLAAAAKVGMVELHTWSSTAEAIDRADRICSTLILTRTCLENGFARPLC